MKTYVTFGQTHAHSVNGKTFDKDCVAVIDCEDEASGRETAFDTFGDKFFTSYPDDRWDESKMLPYYPRGYIELN